MLEHATLATAASGLIGITIGYVMHGVFRGGAVADLHSAIAERDMNLEAHRLSQDILFKKLDAATRDLGKANAEIVRLKPHAEAHRRSKANLAKGSAASVEARKAKAADNVTPIAKPARKRA